MAAPGVLANDLGTGLVENSIVAGPANGTLSPLNANGSFTYTPNAGFSGTDTFTYNDKDGSGTLSNTATVTINVNPQAVNDSYVTTTNAPLVVPAASGVLVNDLGTGLVENSVVTAPSNGTLSPLNANGSFTYTPNAGFSGTDTFTYNVNDGSGNTSNTATVTIIVGPNADVSVTKTDASATYTAGNDISYTLTVNNSGPSDAQTVLLSDPLPAGSTFVSLAVPAGWTRTDATAVGANGTITATLATLTAGAPAQVFTLIVHVNSNVVGNLSNTATISSATPDLAPANNSATDTDTPAPAADLQITKTDGSASAVPGAATTYTIVVTNAGPSDVTGATVKDTLPAAITSATFTATATGGPTGFTTPGAGNINDTVNMPNGSTITYTLVANISSSAAGNLVNTATVAVPPGVTDPTPGNNSASDSDTLTPVSDLSITKTVDNPVQNVGQNVTFTITAHNAGPSDAANVIVTDLLPAGLTFVSSNQAAYDPISGLWPAGTIVNGSNATLTITALVTSAALPNQTNTATVKSDSVDPNGGNNTASATVTPPQADLSVLKTADNASVSVGDPVNFTITITNLGPAAATNVALTDNLPAGETFVSALASQGSYSNATGIWTVGSLANNAVATLKIAAIWSAPGSKTNTAFISASDQFDPVASNNTSSVTVAGKPKADLSLLKTVDVSAPKPGQNVTYTLTLSNGGPSDATGVQVTELLPAGLTLVTAIPSMGTYDSATGVWSEGALSNGANATLSIVATVTGTGSITNSASISASDQPDPNPNNNTSSVSITVTGAPPCAPPVILSAPTAKPSPAVAGTAVTFAVSASDPNGQTLAIAWDFGDGTTGTGASTQHAYTSAGSYAVTVTVTNACGESVNAMLNLVIIPVDCPASTPVVGAPPSLSVDFTQTFLSFNFTASATDPKDGTLTNVSWLFGDGQAGFGTNVQHTYVQPGTYTVEASVTDSLGNCRHVIIFVNAVAPPGTPPTPDQLIIKALTCNLVRVLVNFKKKNADGLMLIAQLDLPPGFDPAGQSATFGIAGFSFSCVLNSRGQYKDAQHYVNFAQVRGKWLATIKIAKDELKDKLGIMINANISSTIHSVGLLIRVGNNEFFSNQDCFYKAIANIKAQLFK